LNRSKGPAKEEVIGFIGALGATIGQIDRANDYPAPVEQRMNGIDGPALSPDLDILHSSHEYL